MTSMKASKMFFLAALWIAAHAALSSAFFVSVKYKPIDKADKGKPYGELQSEEKELLITCKGSRSLKMTDDATGVDDVRSGRRRPNVLGCRPLPQVLGCITRESPEKPFELVFHESCDDDYYCKLEVQDDLDVEYRQGLPGAVQIFISRTDANTGIAFDLNNVYPVVYLKYAVGTFPLNKDPSALSRRQRIFNSRWNFHRIRRSTAVYKYLPMKQGYRYITVGCATHGAEPDDESARLLASTNACSKVEIKYSEDLQDGDDIDDIESLYDRLLGYIVIETPKKLSSMLDPRFRKTLPKDGRPVLCAVYAEENYDVAWPIVSLRKKPRFKTHVNVARTGGEEGFRLYYN